MNFVGKICPYCKSEFKEDDDVVICSVCEMPHHKECWIENKACTTFGCTGTIMGADNYSNSLVCTKCDLVYTEGEEVCSACGSVLLKPDQQLQYAYSSAQQQSLNYNQSQYVNQTSGVSYSQNYGNYYSGYENGIDADMRTFIGRNLEYFSAKFQRFYSTQSKESWNWASAFLGGYWYAYRKMYKNQLLYYVMAILALFIPLLYIALFILSGLFGNYLYKCHAEKHVKIAKSMDDYLKENYLVKKGGTSKVAVWVIVGIRLLLPIILVVIFALEIPRYR